MNKKTSLIYGGLALASLVLLPIFPSVWGIFFTIKFFRQNKKKLAMGTLVGSLVLSGIVISKFPTTSQRKVESASLTQTGIPSPATGVGSVTPEPIDSPVPKLEPTSVNQAASPTSVAVPATPTSETINRTKAKVVKVIDGDTMDFSFDGKTERIRVIGINTPETVDPRKSVECFGKEASRQAKLYLEPGMEVELEADPTQGDRDKYQRLLRYVWTDDGSVDFGKVMISLGYAYEYTYNTPYKYQAIYKQAQREAEAGKKGLWADGACLATPKPATAAPATAKPVTNSGSSYTGSYSCSGPDLDCSDFSTHAQAQAFFDSCGFTATNDPMKLDSVGVGDGVPCESLP